jgi:hypothetical protein
MARIDHTNCTHGSTPRERAQCRADRAFASTTVASQLEILDEMNNQPEIKMTGATARKLARHAAAADRARAARGK